MTPDLNTACAEDEKERLGIRAIKAWGKRIGDEDWCRPAHRPSLDYPGTFVDDWEHKGPHPRIELPDGRVFYLCNCRKHKGEDLDGAAYQLETDLNEAVAFAEWGLAQIDKQDHDRTACEMKISLFGDGSGYINLVPEFGQENELIASYDNLAEALCRATLKALGKW